MNLNLTKKTIALGLIFGIVGLVSQPLMAASDNSVNAALAQDWHIALPAELPPAQPEVASLDQ